MNCMTEYNLCITQGDEKTYNLTFTSGGSPQNITGATVKMTIKSSLDATPLITKIVTSHTDAAAGETAITLSSTDTGISRGNYYYDIQISGGSIPKKTALKGRLEITWRVAED